MNAGIDNLDQRWLLRAAEGFTFGDAGAPDIGTERFSHTGHRPWVQFAASRIRIAPRALDEDRGLVLFRTHRIDWSRTELADLDDPPEALLADLIIPEAAGLSVRGEDFDHVVTEVPGVYRVVVSSWVYPKSVAGKDPREEFTVSFGLIPPQSPGPRQILAAFPARSDLAVSRAAPHEDGMLFDQVVETEYGQFYLAWGSGPLPHIDWEGAFAGQANGLVGAALPDVLCVNLARSSGGSAIKIEHLSGEPEVGDEWEDIVEVSVDVRDGAQLRWTTWAGEDGGALSLPPGTYRVRTSARGRDAGRDNELAEETVDFYLIQLWPAPMRADSIVKLRSRDAAYWHDRVRRQS